MPGGGRISTLSGNTNFNSFLCPLRLSIPLGSKPEAVGETFTTVPKSSACLPTTGDTTKSRGDSEGTISIPPQGGNWYGIAKLVGPA